MLGAAIGYDPRRNKRRKEDIMMNQKWSYVSFGLAALLIFSDIALSATAKPSTVAEIALYKGADRQQILEEGAKKEGKLMFYTTGILTQAVRPVVDAFQKRYPYIQVDIWRAGSEALVPRIVEEYKAGKLQGDVIEGNNHFVLQKMGISQPFYSPHLAYLEEGAVTSAPGGAAFAAAFRSQGNSLGYNTKLLTKDQIPKTYQDLLDPKWKGKMAIAGSDTATRLIGTMLVAKGEDFVRQFAKQDIAVHMVSVRSLLDMIINGEYALSPNITEPHVTNSQKQGAPCDWFPLEPVSVGMAQIAMPKTSQHPHAAMLFVDFELSKECAEINKKLEYSPTRTDVPGLRNYKKFYGPRSLEEALKWDELFNRLFQKK